MSTSLNTTSRDCACPFLDLPGELRNLIFAYTFSEPMGLSYRLDPPGIGRLESMLPATTLPSKVQLDTCKPTPERKALNRRTRRVANQLQYVCHELRAETRGLGIRYNDLSFEYLKDVLAFIRIIPQAEVKHLRILHVKKGMYSTVGGEEVNLLGAPDERYSRLFNFCLAHPALTICNPVIGWRQSDPMFVPYAILVQMQFRKSSSRIEDFFTSPSVQDMVRTITSRKVGQMEEALPANFKMYPEDDTFDSTLFRNTCVGHPMINNFFNHAVDGGVGRWATEAEKIYMHGI
ncbi:hypothetical protein CC86DRAFT_98826 [Ophiobolus disseminans]|uniref:Uncharacterized protein n=1 Tax=Ophiobolus disseminans TaxID=1469910 RepID=A0A6A6ZKP4_9PLEO|nr:hypothetical protein CC86DRAFT_98826 [Ophiobolus disseminans]